MPHSTDLDLIAKDVSELATPDAITALLTKLGYDTADRTLLSPEAVGLAGESASAIKRIELLSEDPERFLRVVFAQPKSLTAKVRNDLVRVLGKSNLDHLLVLASDFDTLEFVFLDKRKREQKGPASSERIQVVPKTISVSRRNPTRLDLRMLRRFTWTCRDALEQFDKLRSVFDAAAYTGEYFQNRGLFSDYYLRDRLREDPSWRDNPSETFAFVRDLLRDAQARYIGKDKDTLRNQLLEPLFKKLGFKATVNRPSRTDQTQPDYILKDSDDGKRTEAFVYAWDRWLDGPDLNDADTPEENPGACVVTALDAGTADWIIVTNGRLWRLYSRQAHARATNFYEVDLVEALTASGDTDPNEAFRYWWLFLRPAAFRQSAEGQGCWLDDILFGSREYAKRLGENLKTRVFHFIFRDIAAGFLQDRKQRLGLNREPTEEELADIFEATLTFLYRLLFLLYAESRDLLPIREAPYQAASLKKIKEEIANKAGVAESDVADALQKAYSAKETTLYDRLCKLFVAMDKGDPILNVPTYNGGLFNTKPDKSDRRDQRIARFLSEHKVPDRFLALAIDRLARDQDERTLALVFIDYKSLEVRHLGSIYEGLLEFKLKVADEDLTTQADKKGETYIALSQAKVKRGKQAAVVVKKKEVYLSNDKFEPKASGSYYTPDPIVEYIVANTVGPVLEEKLETLRPEFRKVRKTFDNELQKCKAYPSKAVKDGTMDPRQWAGQQTYNAHKDLVENLFDLRVLDPAMGSGHFLVETVDYVTDHLLKFLNQFPINPVNFALERTRTSILESLGEQGVTVDPAKLTDINLLKRHVLKRCIYGVDLNPMAVELAKVSLWLDAFTLGAPLNFLDHHLRFGNSLIGATFKELEEATTTLFALNYEPLLRAIKNVLFVSKMADATAAEVATSVNRYDQARQSLAGYQIVLNLLVAEHFGIPKSASLVKEGQDLKLEGRETLLASLHDDKERKLVAQVEALAQRPDRRFFHWEIEFPEVFFGFVDDDHRQIKHKDRIEEGTAGFDCVVGNPPYVRTERLDATSKNFFSACHSHVHFDLSPFSDADVILLDESHNFRNDKANRYLALDTMIQLNGGRGRDGEHKKVILLSATPINNDLYDLANQVRLFTQSRPDYFREAGIGDFNAYFRRARRMVRKDDVPAGVVLFNLLEEVMVRNTRPYLRAAYPNATIKGKPVAFPNRRLHTVEYDLGAAYGGLYDEIVAAIDSLSLAPYKLEAYKKKSAIADEEQHKFEQGREEGLVGIFKTRFLKRLESSLEAFRLSLRRALTFEETYKDYLLDRKVVSSKDFQKAIRFLARDEEDDSAAGSMADELDAVAEAKAYIDSLPTVDLNQYELRKLTHDVEADVKTLKNLYERTEGLAADDGKLVRLKKLLTGELNGKKVLIFSTFKDTTRYLHRRLTEDAKWLKQAGSPHIRRIDSGNHPNERGRIIAQFAPDASGLSSPPEQEIDVLISTDVLSEGQNLQDCGLLVNYDLTWNPIRLVQRNGRIDRIGSPHAEIGIYNLFPEAELEALLHLIERLTDRISTIDDLGLLDASVLGEVVHPRTFNTLRRIREEDGTVLDEEEARAELAGPEMLLKQLKDLLNRDGANTLTALPNGIHSGLRREKCYGMFFYFQAPRSGEGRRHFWRYIDARTEEIRENRYEIAQLISCLPDEPRYVGDQDVFVLQDKVIEHILAADREAEAKAAAPTAVDPIQQTVSEEIKDGIRRRSVDREKAKACIRFLGQPMGRALHAKLKAANENWKTSKNDAMLVEEVAGLLERFGKQKSADADVKRLCRQDLELICFEYVSG